MKEEFKSNTGKDDKFIKQIFRAIENLEYGYVQITVQDSKVVQIDRTEKFRLDGQNSLNLKGGNSG
ncbi:MAG: YezD family protein [Candidatus Brocadiaceae bacterium]